MVFIEYIELTFIFVTILIISTIIYHLFFAKILKRIGEIRFSMESTRLDIIFQIFSNMRDISLYKKYRYFFDIFSKVDNNYFETVKKIFL